METNKTTEFEQLVTEYKSTVYSVCFMFVKTRAEADDLFQEVLIHLWEGYDNFRGDASVRSWIYRVSINTCISYKRKKRVKTIPLDIDPNLFEGESFESRQTLQLQQRISKLEPIDRAIVLLWLENMQYDEIAAIIGSSTKAIGVRLVRIKEKLKNL